MLAAVKTLLLLSFFLIINVEACPRPADPKPDIYDVFFPEIDTEDPRCCHEIEQNYCFSSADVIYLHQNPECPERIFTTFTLFTRSTPSGVPISVDNVPLAFSYSRINVLIVHGYFESFNPKYQELKDALLKKNDYNVIALDWQIGAGRDFFQSISNSNIMGEYLGILVNFLRRQPGSNLYFWCIGHGLGAHICGATSKRAIPLLDRITAVDPLLSLLLRDNATRVDVIHTYPDLTYRTTIGHVDFYPNGGTSQPGCTAVVPQHDFKLPETRRKIANEGLSCNHRRAMDYMIHSINSPLCYVATHTCSTEKNMPYFCTRIPSNEQKGHMGHDAINHRYQGILYFEVDSKSPYCSVGRSTC